MQHDCLINITRLSINELSAYHMTSQITLRNKYKMNVYKNWISSDI